MIINSNVKVTICFNDSASDDETRDQEVQKLLKQLQESVNLGEIEAVDRVPNPNLPEGSKSLGGWMVGLLTAEVNVENFKKFAGFMGDRLIGKVIELKVEANGRKLEVKVKSQADLKAAIAAAQDFVEGK
jgi:hypothetical protein